jgi:hypothetical protein
MFNRFNYSDVTQGKIKYDAPQERTATTANECAFCKHGVPLIAEYKGADTAQIKIDGKELIADINNGYLWVDIEYCPMCGRKL